MSFSAFISFSIQFAFLYLFGVALASFNSFDSAVPTGCLTLTLMVKSKDRVVITWMSGLQNIGIGRR